MRINTLQECVSIGVCSGHESIALVLPIALPGPDPLPLLGGSHSILGPLNDDDDDDDALCCADVIPGTL